jgi:hypothetical protein
MTIHRSLLAAFCLVCLNTTPFLVTAFDEEVSDAYTLEFPGSNQKNQINQLRQKKRILKEGGGKKRVCIVNALLAIGSYKCITVTN